MIEFYEVDMELREYLFRKRITISEFSKQINYTRTHISDIMSRKRKAGKKVAKIIEEATNGIVSAEEVLNPKPIEDFDEEMYKKEG